MRSRQLVSGVDRLESPPIVVAEVIAVDVVVVVEVADAEVLSLEGLFVVQAPRAADAASARVARVKRAAVELVMCAGSGVSEGNCRR